MASCACWFAAAARVVGIRARLPLVVEVRTPLDPAALETAVWGRSGALKVVEARTSLDAAALDTAA